ncbi:MAG: HD domain-containing phosphohydrolase [Massilia sp.]
MNDADDEDWLIDDDDLAAPAAHSTERPWRVLVVDDDPDVHAVTRLALRNVSFKGRELELFSAHSGAEGYRVLSETADVALVLLDVVMETEDAGLVLARRIREDLGNHTVRVVLRTGQPGQAPEQRVIIDYDINDYKAKTELTTQRLFTAVISALRAYESLTMLERSRAGLGRILAGVTNLYQAGSLREFASGVLGQVSAVLGIGGDGMLCVLAAPGRDPAVLAATGVWANLADRGLLPHDHPLRPGFLRAFAEQEGQHSPLGTLLPIHTMQQQRLGIAVCPPLAMGDMQRDLLELYCQRIAAAFDNQFLYEQVKKTQAATVALLAQCAEQRHPGAAAHAERVRALSVRIAERMQERGCDDPELTAQLISTIGLASMLHDIGMSQACDGWPDDAPYTPEQRAAMQRHPDIGRAMLEQAASTVDGYTYLQCGAQIAAAHQERFDGSGYPNGLVGRAIPLCARIVAVADSFDGMTGQRPYRPALSCEAALAELRAEAGVLFDPEVVAAMLDIAGSDCAGVAPHATVWQTGQ